MNKIVDGIVYKMTEKEIEESVYIPTNEEKIVNLKQQLADTDYKAIKYAEGWLTNEEYAPIKEQRQAIRDEINRLESELI